MKTKDILELMSKLFADLKLHPLFIEEIRSLLKKELRGKESEFFRVLGTQLSNIQQFGPLIHKVDSNETLKWLERTYYSIHLQRSQFNVRMLVYITPEDVPLFLCAFYERSGKKQTGYQKYLDVLDCRLHQMLGGEDDEC